ncbi:ligand-binding receptor [Candidimonas sp. SYP-B2681]|uniref:ABC transporter substrate-binding protein n=1 Tax=Candidimonas sp. SYP-B2681 TaxID=2497686 RepID=UPI000F8610F7|nr:ABC transporter substrate-binding protein [Candidimonas sp. SYP-B2681]RTZ41559.1 ligand-binding receptor [Candidimonas sp. SYP-B2681]
MKRNKLARGALLALSTSLSLVCFQAAAQVQVGVINSLSGVFSAFGKRYDTGMQVALEEINKGGGIKGQPVELVIQDDRSEAQSALAAVESMKNKGVPLVLGSYASSITGPMARLMAREKIPLIVLGSADDSITRPGSDWVFRAKHNSTIVATTYFSYFEHLRSLDSSLKKIAVLHGNGAWPTSLADEGVRQAKARGYEVVERQSYDQGTTDFRPILNRFRNARPDILFIGSYADDGVAITRQLKEVGLNAKAIAIDTSSSLPSFIEQVGPLAEQIVSVVSWSKDVKLEGVQNLYKRLKDKAKGEPSFYEAEGYLALMVAADALKRADPKDRESVRKALAETNLDTPVTHVVFKNDNGFKGQNPIKSLVVQIQNGEHVTVFPTDLAAKKIQFPTPPWNER